MATVENVNIEINQKLLDELAALKAENKQLTLDNEATGDLARIWANKNDELEAENERLKEENKTVYSAGLMCERILAKDEIDKLNIEVAQLTYRLSLMHEENERLKKSIEEDVYVKALRDTCDKLVLENERLKENMEYWLSEESNRIKELEADKTELLEALKELKKDYQENLLLDYKKVCDLLSKHVS